MLTVCALVLTCCMCLHLQGVARQSAEAVSVRLGGADGQPQAQLDDFKSRALRTSPPAQRHLYVTAWRAIDAGAARGAAMLVMGNVADECTRVPSRASRHELAAEAGGGAWAVIVLAEAIHRASLMQRALLALEVALALVQAQGAITCPPPL